MPADASTNRIAGLEALLKGRQGKGPAPVEKWNPPYCGDIGMKIRADGVWIYGGTPIGRMPLVKLFAGVLRKDADGKHYLVTPVEKVDVDVADAPFLAVEMEVQGSGREQSLIFRTNVDDIVTAGPEHPLRFAVEPGEPGPQALPAACAAGSRRWSRARSTTISSSWPCETDGTQPRAVERRRVLSPCRPSDPTAKGTRDAERPAAPHHPPQLQAPEPRADRQAGGRADRPHRRCPAGPRRARSPRQAGRSRAGAASSARR